ncbi:flagellar hook-basal body complex protein FliE [Acetobacterium sp.]|uniref:flagellar hook-basal body complex protein FliE n=1 Tax=Acetobacterium sp. TaxID=1872094 RepID=UPI002F43002F
MFIVPMSSIIGQSGIGSVSKSLDSTAAVSGDKSGSGFKDMVQSVINNVESTEAATKVDAYNLSIGNMDDTHTMMINSAKADVALQTMVQLRNKVLDAYSQVMNTNL